MTEEYSTTDLRQYAADEFRAEPTGDYTLNRKGKRVPVTRGVFYITTPVGRFQEDKWCDLTEEAVRREGKTELYEAIKSHCKAHFPWLRTEKMLRRWALDCLTGGAYEYWDDFKGVQT